MDGMSILAPANMLSPRRHRADDEASAVTIPWPGETDSVALAGAVRPGAVGTCREAAVTADLAVCKVK